MRINQNVEGVGTSVLPVEPGTLENPGCSLQIYNFILFVSILCWEFKSMQMPTAFFCCWQFLFRGYFQGCWRHLRALSLQFLTLIIFWTRIFLCEMTQSWDSGVSISSLKLSYRFRAAPLSWMLGHGQPGGEGEKSLLSAQPFDSHCFSPLVVAIAISERQLHQT